MWYWCRCYAGAIFYIFKYTKSSENIRTIIYSRIFLKTLSLFLLNKRYLFHVLHFWREFKTMTPKYKTKFSIQARCPPTGNITNENVAERSRTSANRTRTWQNESAVCTRRSRLRFVSVLRMFYETKQNEKSWAVFNFAAIFRVLCYHMWRFKLVIGRYQLKMAVSSIVSNAQLSKSYVATIGNPLPHANFYCDSFWIRSDMVCYVFVCDFAMGRRVERHPGATLSEFLSIYSM